MAPHTCDFCDFLASDPLEVADHVRLRHPDLGPPMPPGPPPPPEVSARPPAPPSGFRRCPKCAEDIRAEATMCRFCGSDVASAEPRRVPWVPILVGVLAALVGAAFLYTTLQGNGTEPTATGEAAPSTVEDEFDLAAVADEELGPVPSISYEVDASTLTIDWDAELAAGVGEFEEATDAIEAVLASLEFDAEAVTARMGETRALDGTQRATSEIAEATWTYHPDDGLGVVINLTDD